jgi:phage repressor protein C with HTH and peptisase S24 domain
MTQPLFQPGDRVVCVDPGPTSLVEGRVYVVEFSKVGGIKVREHPCAWYDATRFRKV